MEIMILRWELSTQKPQTNNVKFAKTSDKAILWLLIGSFNCRDRIQIGIPGHT